MIDNIVRSDDLLQSIFWTSVYESVFHKEQVEYWSELPAVGKLLHFRRHNHRVGIEKSMRN